MKSTLSVLLITIISLGNATASTVEDQIKDFKESLISVGGDPSKLIMLDDLLYSEYRTQKCTYEDSDFERMSAVIEKCHNLNIIIESSLYQFEPHSFQGEDQKAINALNNAKAKAAIFQKEFGYKQMDIVSINDDSGSSAYNDFLVNRSEEEREIMMEFLTLLNENDSGSTMHSRLSPREKKSSTYTLEITFCLSNN